MYIQREVIWERKDKEVLLELKGVKKKKREVLFPFLSSKKRTFANISITLDSSGARNNGGGEPDKHDPTNSDDSPHNPPQYALRKSLPLPAFENRKLGQLSFC